MPFLISRCNGLPSCWIAACTACTTAVRTLGITAVCCCACCCAAPLLHCCFSCVSDSSTGSLSLLFPSLFFSHSTCSLFNFSLLASPLLPNAANCTQHVTTPYSTISIHQTGHSTLRPTPRLPNNACGSIGRT